MLAWGAATAAKKDTSTTGKSAPTVTELKMGSSVRNVKIVTRATAATPATDWVSQVRPTKVSVFNVMVLTVRFVMSSLVAASNALPDTTSTLYLALALHASEMSVKSAAHQQPVPSAMSTKPL